MLNLSMTEKLLRKVIFYNGFIKKNKKGSRLSGSQFQLLRDSLLFFGKIIHHGITYPHIGESPVIE